AGSKCQEAFCSCKRCRTRLLPALSTSMTESVTSSSLSLSLTGGTTLWAMRNSINWSRNTTWFRGLRTRHFFQRGSATRQWRDGDDRMNGIGQATMEMAGRYFDLFVNRLAYTMQSHKPNGNGKHYYYRPRNDRRL